MKIWPRRVSKLAFIAFHFGNLVCPRILIVSIDTEVCLLRASIRPGMLVILVDVYDWVDSWNLGMDTRFHCSLYWCREIGEGKLQFWEIYKLSSYVVVYGKRRSEMAHGRIYGTIVCLHYEARSQSMAMLMRCIWWDVPAFVINRIGMVVTLAWQVFRINGGKW